MASTGSANMDLRSFKLNFEVNAFIYDEKVIKEMKKDFFKDLNNSEELDEIEFKNRKIDIKIKQSICRLFSPIL